MCIVYLILVWFDVHLYNSSLCNILCSCYLLLQSESVDLALQLLDESELRGHKIHVEKAKFEMKGNYDPNKRKYKKLSNKEKRKAKENQAK